MVPATMHRLEGPTVHSTTTLWPLGSTRHLFSEIKYQNFNNQQPPQGVESPDHDGASRP